MICKFCGGPLRPDSPVCRYCGHDNEGESGSHPHARDGHGGENLIETMFTALSESGDSVTHAEKNGDDEMAALDDFFAGLADSGGSKQPDRAPEDAGESHGGEHGTVTGSQTADVQSERGSVEPPPPAETIDVTWSMKNAGDLFPGAGLPGQQPGDDQKPTDQLGKSPEWQELAGGPDGETDSNTRQNELDELLSGIDSWQTGQDPSVESDSRLEFSDPVPDGREPERRETAETDEVAADGPAEEELPDSNTDAAVERINQELGDGSAGSGQKTSRTEPDAGVDDNVGRTPAGLVVGRDVMEPAVDLGGVRAAEDPLPTDTDRSDEPSGDQAESDRTVQRQLAVDQPFGKPPEIIDGTDLQAGDSDVAVQGNGVDRSRDITGLQPSESAGAVRDGRAGRTDGLSAEDAAVRSTAVQPPAGDSVPNWPPVSDGWLTSELDLLTDDELGYTPEFIRRPDDRQFENEHIPRELPALTAEPAGDGRLSAGTDYHEPVAFEPAGPWQDQLGGSADGERQPAPDIVSGAEQYVPPSDIPAAGSGPDVSMYGGEMVSDQPEPANTFVDSFSTTDELAGPTTEPDGQPPAGESDRKPGVIQVLRRFISQLVKRRVHQKDNDRLSEDQTVDTPVGVQPAGRAGVAVLLAGLPEVLSQRTLMLLALVFSLTIGGLSGIFAAYIQYRHMAAGQLTDGLQHFPPSDARQSVPETDSQPAFASEDTTGRPPPEQPGQKVGLPGSEAPTRGMSGNYFLSLDEVASAAPKLELPVTAIGGETSIGRGYIANIAIGQSRQAVMDANHAELIDGAYFGDFTEPVLVIDRPNGNIVAGIGGDGRINVIETRSSYYRTEEGITVGMSFARVREKYGDVRIIYIDQGMYGLSEKARLLFGLTSNILPAGVAPLDEATVRSVTVF
ncbi:MAG: hypothetical protein N3A57_04375 [Negativicutes bacterium]|nr:hypothetical protein [Negativicutes bacterium]